MSTSKVKSLLRMTSNVVSSPIFAQAVGGALGIFLAEMVRRGSHHIIESVDDAMRISALIHDTDPSFDWIVHFVRHQIGSSALSLDPDHDSRLRSGDVSLIRELAEYLYPQGKIPPSNMKLITIKPDDSLSLNADVDEDEDDALPNDPRKSNSEVDIWRMPLDSLNLILPFGNQKFRFRMIRVKDSESTRLLEISVISTDRSRDQFFPLLYHARTLYLSHSATSLKVNMADVSPSWWGWRRSFKPLRSWDSIFLPQALKDKVLSDTRNFLDNRSFYRKRGLPWRRGWLLFGLPGTGKTSLITALASHFNLGIYIVNLGAKGIDDDYLLKLVTSIPPKSILLFEDIDCAFQGTRGNACTSTPMDPVHFTAPFTNPIKTKTEHTAGLPLGTIEEAQSETIGRLGNEFSLSEELTPDTVHVTPGAGAQTQVNHSAQTSSSMLGGVPNGDKLDNASSASPADVAAAVEPANDDNRSIDEIDTHLPRLGHTKILRDYYDDLAPSSRITLSGLLNAIDGIAATEGRILFCTTNWKDRIDPALYRPGRCDVWLEFTWATPQQAFDLFKYFYHPEKV
ncbi:uncharacterized protein I303_106241 [Kwoniella dejecticola CBS 10117]|uniref:AAA+ ATPase domain-containing protein n=1 Tax=Kwoniella dejecticola CBS 10117 TaxID=1296121 RepID=A0A1A6A1N4_9TREE|nr:uncharacterized protein I303_06260 [Kwoniella dejecticola CBS 10117]OBR83973.1 hypothetical protein I303_06260 [Kwoniella dejecticola CBS 10117]